MSQRTTGGSAFVATDTATTSKGAVKAETKSQKLVAANDGRIAVYVSNDGEKTVYLALGAAAAKNEGIRLLKTDPPLRIEGYTGEITVITAAEESVVCFTEV